ncbi:MAG: tyrosine-type recombinase/integrase [Chloroflexi bacterium]|nr:tyrosine-type recombinase/integrase [Chloroflexota bacterium]
MTPKGKSLRQSDTAAGRYDCSLHWARDKRLPPGYPAPQPTSAWPPENLALLERYREWLMGSGTSRFTLDHLYLAMAGHVLGLNLKPPCELDLETDLNRALDYIKAKQLSAEWTDMCRNALEKFRRFLRQERGAAEVSFPTPDLTRYRVGLPDWLVQELERYQRLRQRNWRPARLNQQILNFWQHHTGLWRWLYQRHAITGLGEIRRPYILDYVDHRLSQERAASTINDELRYFHGFLLFLQEREYPIPQALLRLPALKQADSLPKFLTDEQVRRLRDDFESRVAQARFPGAQRDALLDRAAFYLMWQGGLRLGEVEELRLEDLDLAGGKLMVRQGKGLKDRTVYLTETVIRAVHAYLNVRGMGPDDHVFLYRNQPVKKDLLHCRIKYAGERVGVQVSPHRLRHTCATQLLNAGCRVTSIQKVLGHRRLNSTMIYARVHDRTVAEDYYTAMAQVETRLKLAPPAEEQEIPLCGRQRAQLLELAAQLAEPELSIETRLILVDQIRLMLNGTEPAQMTSPTEANGNGLRSPPQSVPIFRK